MILLLLFAFIAGVVTILSPCILPLLPIILASSTDSGKSRPLGIVSGFVISFTLFTLFLSQIVKLFGLSADSLRLISVVILIFFGLSLAIPALQTKLSTVFSRFTNIGGRPSGSGIWRGLLIGFSLGILWTPCVGPILAGVIVLAATNTVTTATLAIILSYSLGTAIPMLLIIKGGRKLLDKVPFLTRNTEKIQQLFGGLMILTAIGIGFNLDRNFQTLILNKFPNYGTGLTQFEGLVATPPKTADNSQETKIPAPEIIAGGQWFGSVPLSIKSLRGKVVLLDFWTYSCINCQRTLPYLKSWWDKYHEMGLVIIGVHSPEFEFEKNPQNVQKAINDFGLKYPVVQDNNFATWKAYENQYWPAKYFIDKDGFIRYVHFGEGAYDESEKRIQDLLKETGATVSGMVINNPTYQVFGQTPETYLGLARLGAGVSFLGKWHPSDEYTNPEAGAFLEMDFNAKDVYLVMRNKGQTAKLKVFLDGTAYAEVAVTEDKLYQLIKLDTPGKHKLKLEFEDNQAELYAFTFG